MRAELKGWHSADVDVETYVSQTPENDSVAVQLLCGPLGESAEESFDVLICTPKAIAAELDAIDCPRMGRHLLIQRHLDLVAAKAFVEKYIRSLDGDTWSDLAERLARLGMWEFEDYQPSDRLT